MKLTDYVALFLKKEGIKHVFGLTGGAVVHFFDSIAKTPGITPIFTHHEQAASMAAEAYSRITNNMGAAIVTTGPGGTNAITGLTAAWLDSIPAIYISGQTRFRHSSRGKSIRQLGNQELDIVSVVSHLTKFAVMVDDPNKIRYYLEKAAYIARSGRPGPVWLDVPLDFQWMEIEPDKIAGFNPNKIKKIPNPSFDSQLDECIKLLNQSSKPLIVAGYGIRLAHAENEFIKFIETFKIPYVSTWNASDLMPTNHPLYTGRVGLMGQKGANLAINGCDLILSLGSHLCLTITGLDTDAFAPKAKKIVVDIDPSEINFRSVKTDAAIQSDVKVFISKLQKSFSNKSPLNINEWRSHCRNLKDKNAIPKEFFKQKKYVNHYVFIDKLSDKLTKNDVIVVDGGGTVVYTSMQGFKIKKGQRMILSTGICSMGTGLPESIGACFANKKNRTICTIGDGSMQLNVQELQTIVHHKLPVKIFLFNNRGYLSIRITQNTFLEKRLYGSTAKGGMSLPDYKKIAFAYGIKYIRINSHKEIDSKTKEALAGNYPVICEVMVSPDQKLLS